MLGAYKALFVVLSLGLAVFWVAEKALPSFITLKEFRQWRNLWLAVIVAAFVSQYIWLFYVLTLITILLFVPAKPSIKISYYLLLVCALPQMMVIIPGIGGIKALFPLTYPRLLVITLFLGLYFSQKNIPRLFSLSSDKYIVAFTLLIAMLNFRDSTITNSIRETFIVFIDVFIPYFIISRHITSLEEMNRVLFALLLGIAPLALIGVFETAKHWLVFSELKNALFHSGLYYDVRAEGLRATASTSGPIVLGYIMVIGLGLLLYLKQLLTNRKVIYLAGLIIFSCLLATKARGPWLGLVLLIMAYIWTGKEALKGYMKAILVVIATLPILFLTPSGQKFLELLPFVGSIRSDTIDYRSRLMDTSWVVIQKNPWFGSTTYLDTPEMESMRQGQGIIDLVNSYIQITLAYGGVGLTLFIAIFLSLLFQCFQTIKRLPNNEIALIRMGRSLIATLSTILFMIFTVSSIDSIPIFYWAFAGIITAYLRIANQSIRHNVST